MLASTNYINEDLNHKRKDNFVQFARGEVLLRIGDNDYSAKVIVGYTSGNQMVLYDVVDFVKTSINVKKWICVRRPMAQVPRTVATYPLTTLYHSISVLSIVSICKKQKTMH